MLQKTKKLLEDAKGILPTLIHRGDKAELAAYYLDLLDKKIDAQAQLAIHQAYTAEHSEKMHDIKSEIAIRVAEETDDAGKKRYSNDMLRKAAVEDMLAKNAEYTYLQGKMRQDQDLSVEEDRYVSTLNALIAFAQRL